MNSKPLTLSERRARALLAAWNSADLARLEDTIESTVALSQAPLSTSEQERLDLLQEVASTIRTWVSTASSEHHSELKMSLGLLRHLARCERESEVADVIEPHPLTQDITATLQLEMLASVPN